MPCSFHNWTEEYYRDTKRLQTLLGGKDFTSLYEKVVKMSNRAHNLIRLECGILTDISSPPSPTFKYTLPLEIKDSLLEYHRSKFPLIDYIHSSKYRVHFYKIQNPYRNWCDVTRNMCIRSRQIQKHARKVSSCNIRKKQFKRYRYKCSYFFVT